MKHHTFVLLLSIVVLTSPALLAQPEPFSVRITFGYTDPEEVRWTGSVMADQASITSLEGWLFLAPDSISFNTFEISAGGPVNKGLTITGSASSGGRISVLTDHGSFSVPVFSLRLGNPVKLLDGAAQAERLPDAMDLSDGSGEDDYPSIAVGKDSTAWAVWQSYRDQFDEVRFAKYEDKWRTYTVLPGVSGDVWRPQVAIDQQQRPTVVWSQQVKGNFDLYARTLDPEQKTWLKTRRLTSHPNSDIDHHLISDNAGNLWLVWQGFHGDNSDVFLRRYDGSGWSEEVRITDHPANDWEPRIAVDSRGKAYIVWDSYRNGNYDIFMRTLEDGTLGPEVAVADTPRFEAHPTVAVDREDRVWVAWDESGPNWGKDHGPTVDPDWRGKDHRERLKLSPGVQIYEPRNINLVVFDGATRRVPVADFHPLVAGVGESYDYPQLLIDRHDNRIALLFHRQGTRRGQTYWGQVYWETALTFYQGEEWSPILPMPQSWGRSSARPAGAYDPDGSLQVIWPTDSRLYIWSHRPVAQKIYTARIPSQRASAQPSLQLWSAPPEMEVKPGHANEPQDVKAIRSYRSFVHGVEKRIVRGDFHRHTELSWDAGGRIDGSLFDFYRYMIDAAAMDFGAVTDHMSGGNYDYWKWLIEKSCDMYHIPSIFTTFYAYERSAVFPDGHRNIFHTRRGVPVVKFFTETDYEGFPPPVATARLVENDTKLLYESLHQTGGIAISHTSTSPAMGTDWRDNDPEVEPVVEIFQGDRVSSEHRGAPRAARSAEDKPPGGFQEAGFLWNAYRKGYRLGTITSSDHFSTNISYAMVYTEQPTREAIFEGFRKRHTYGATDNIILDFRMGDHFMGEEFTTSSLPPLEIRLIGTSEVASVEIIKNEEVIFTTTPNQQDVELTFMDQDATSGTSYYYVRVIQDDRQIAWSSPIWMNYRP